MRDKWEIFEQFFAVNLLKIKEKATVKNGGKKY
jgi:hypothetical protein